MTARDDRSGYLMDEPHWRVTGVDDLGRFFLAATRLTGGDGVLCIAEGAWPPSVRDVLDRIGVDRQQPPHPGRGCEDDRARHVLLTPGHAASLARMADEHAEPEIGLHFTVFRGSSRVLEWFDAVGDPISIEGSTDEDAVNRFAREAGGRAGRIGAGT